MLLKKPPRSPPLGALPPAPKSYSRNASDHLPSECSLRKASMNLDANLPAASLSSFAGKTGIGVLAAPPDGAPPRAGPPRPPPPPPSAAKSVPTGFSSVTLPDFFKTNPTAKLYP